MENILIICAMPKEAKFIAEKLNMKQLKDNLYKSKNITLLISGIGKQRTAISLTEYLCQNIKPDKIINIGYAGSTDIEIGKWVNITKSYNYEWEIPGEEKYSMLDFGNQNLQTLQNNNIKKVDCYSAECFVTSTNIEEHVAFDMELHSIAILCDKYSIPLYALKKISDNLNLENFYENINKQDIFELHSCLKLLEEENIITTID